MTSLASAFIWHPKEMANIFPSCSHGILILNIWSWAKTLKSQEQNHSPSLWLFRDFQSGLTASHTPSELLYWISALDTVLLRRSASCPWMPWTLAVATQAGCSLVSSSDAWACSLLDSTAGSFLATPTFHSVPVPLWGADTSLWLGSSSLCISGVCVQGIGHTAAELEAQSL